jgi:hypothetical protein
MINVKFSKKIFFLEIATSVFIMLAHLATFYHVGPPGDCRVAGWASPPLYIYIYNGNRDY